MTAVQASLPLSHFYRETLGADHLSQNLASNELFTPLQLNRTTVSPTRYENYRASLEKQPRLPWGRLRDYGGLQKIQLPEEYIKLRGYPPEVVQKGHRHYGTGASDARDLKVEQYYDITSLHRSHVRTSDQVLPPSPNKEMNLRQIILPFPSEHPNTSHMSRFALFPTFNTPDDPIGGDPARSSKPLHSNTPANAHKVLIINKAKGATFRRELQEHPQESDKDPLTWNGENDFYQLKKSVDGGRQPYYPTPPKVVHPNLRLRNEEQRLELRTVNALRNIEREQWKTTYDYNYTGCGPSNAMHLDDYHKKMVEEIQSGRASRSNDLLPTTSPSFFPPRPLEGRYARLYQQKRHLTAAVRYSDDDPLPDPSDVMDARDYISLPGSARSLRRKDEWYKRGKISAETDVAKKVTLQEDQTAMKPILTNGQNDKETDIQWKSMQLQSHPDPSLEKVIMQRNDEPDPRASGEYEQLPKIADEYVKIQERGQDYLKDYQDERDLKFKFMEREHNMEKFELQYQPIQNVHAMRNKVDQLGTRIQPKAFGEHQNQVANDIARMRELKNGKSTVETSYNTGLKYSTETISDSGSITKLHDRQLEGYSDFPTTWIKDIPKTDPPEQNHQGSLENYVSKTNPFALSRNVEGTKFKKQSEEGVLNLSGSSTGSILKTSESPPRTGSSKSISFNEVVRVATTEYGSGFRVTTSPLSSSGLFTTKNTSRPLTPFPLPQRPRSEPSLYTDISLTGPALRPSSGFPHQMTRPPTQKHWSWNYDTRLKAEFEPLSWIPNPSSPRNQSSLQEIQKAWSKADAHRRFNENFTEQAPDMRDSTRDYELADRSADLRYHHSIKHKEKRHQFYGFNSYHFYNGNPIA